MHSSGRVPLFPTNTNQVAMSMSTQNQNIRYPVSVFPVMSSNIYVSNHDNVPLPSASTSNVRRPNQLSEREMNRKLKKKYLERCRRAKINDQTRAMYDLVFRMFGENTARKTEICEMLRDCLTLMEYIYKAVEEDQNLKSRFLPPGILLSSSSGRCTRMQDPVTLLRQDKENSEPRSFASAFSPVSAHPSFIQTTSTPMERCRRKRESSDSGLEHSQSSNFSKASSSLSRESLPPKKSRLNHDSYIWRPYLD